MLLAVYPTLTLVNPRLPVTAIAGDIGVVGAPAEQVLGAGVLGGGGATTAATDVPAAEIVFTPLIAFEFTVMF